MITARAQRRPFWKCGLAFIPLILVLFPTHLPSQVDVSTLISQLDATTGFERLRLTNEIALRLVDQDPMMALRLINDNYKPEFGNYDSPFYSEALLIKGHALLVRDQLDSSVFYLEQARERFDRSGDKFGLARAQILLGRCYGERLELQVAKDLLQDAISLAIQINNKKYESIGLRDLGWILYLEHQEDSCITLYHQSMEIQRIQGDSMELSETLFYLGRVLSQIDRKEEGLNAFVSARDLKASLHDAAGLARVNNSLGILHEENGNLETALEYYRSSLTAYLKVGDRKNHSRVLNNIGIVYLDMSNYDSATYYLESSLKLRREIQHFDGVTQSLMNLGELYQSQEKFQDALQYLRMARLSSLKHNTRRPLPSILGRMGTIFLNRDQLDSAEHYILASLKERQQQKIFFNQRTNYQQLSELYEKKGFFEEALAAYRQYSAIKDSLATFETKRQLAEVQEKYDAEKRESEILRLRDLSAKSARSRNVFALALLLSLLAIFAIYRFLIFRNRKNQELIEMKEEQRKELLKLNELKSRFFSNISHEFRTPLTLILGPLDQLLESARNEDDVTKLKTIKRNGQRLLKLINQLLELSKIEAGKIPLMTHYLDLIPLLRGWVTSFQSLADLKGIQLGLLSDKDRYLMYIDREKIENIVVNLISNAIKFTEAGGEVRVELQETQVKGKPWLGIKVIDTGSGIPEQELEHVFDRFYQASNADVAQTIGTGIGLSLIKEMVDLHKGQISVESEVGVGSTFELLLPMGKEHLAESEISSIVPSPRPVEIMKEVGITAATPVSADADFPLALIIEDNEDLQLYIQDILSAEYRIETAGNGEVGIELALELVPDLIISDVMMPKKDGIAVCQTLKNDPRTSHIPIILLTAQSSLEDRLRGLSHLADDFISKPFNVKELKQRSRNLVLNRKNIHKKFSGPDILSPRKIQMSSMDQVFMEDMTDLIEENIGNEFFGVNELSEKLLLSRSQLYRKVKFITDLTPVEFIRSYRLQRAKDLLEQKTANVGEVAYQVGFQNASYFAKIFAEKFGKTPSEVLRA